MMRMNDNNNNNNKWWEWMIMNDANDCDNEIIILLINILINEEDLR